MTIEKEIVMAVLGLDPRIDPAIARRLRSGSLEFPLIAGIVLDNGPSMPYVVLTCSKEEA